MDWLSEHLAGVFLGLAIVFGIAEMFSLDLVLLMLALGALVGMVAALLGAPGAVAAIAAAAASVACLALVRPKLVKRLHTGPARYGEDGDGLAWLERHAGTTGTCDVPWARGRGLG